MRYEKQSVFKVLFWEAGRKRQTVRESDRKDSGFFFFFFLIGFGYDFQSIQCEIPQAESKELCIVLLRAEKIRSKQALIDKSQSCLH